MNFIHQNHPLVSKFILVKLRRAAAAGDLSTVQHLVEEIGVDPNIAAKNGATALHKARKFKK